ncbi:MAG TPA: hypothetical protein VK395_36545 [Gemmataceae bacterium]|nr:hypothetical protein [Gemmataceae bacterium]
MKPSLFDAGMQTEKLKRRTIWPFVKEMRERKPYQGEVRLAPLTIKNYPVALKIALGRAVEQKPMPSLPAFPAIRVPKKKPHPMMYSRTPSPGWRSGFT